MYVVAAISQKGGSGKTTLTTNLAVAAVLRGQTALIVDLDPQASASNWADGRSAAPIVVTTPPMRLDHLLEGARADGIDLVLIDTAPHAERASLIAARAADLILIPCRPAYFDLAAMQDSAAIAELAGTPAIVVVNGTPPQQARVDDAVEAIEASGLQVVPVRIGHRVAFQDAAAAGAGVLELAKHSKAAAEINQLFDLIDQVPQ